MPLADRLTEYIAACFTGLWIESHEHEDALRELARMCHDENFMDDLKNSYPEVNAAYKKLQRVKKLPSLKMTMQEVQTSRTNNPFKTSVGNRTY